MAKYYLYELSDPITDEVCYVGITNDLQRRKSDHLRGLGFANHYYAILWAARISESKNVTMTVIGEFDSKRLASFAEKKRIFQYADDNYPLVNSTHYLARKRITNIDIKNRFEATRWYKDFEK